MRPAHCTVYSSNLTLETNASSRVRSAECRFVGVRRVFPCARGIEPRGSAWQAGILSTFPPTPPCTTWFVCTCHGQKGCRLHWVSKWVVACQTEHTMYMYSLCPRKFDLDFRFWCPGKSEQEALCLMLAPVHGAWWELPIYMQTFHRAITATLLYHKNLRYSKFPGGQIEYRISKTSASYP